MNFAPTAQNGRLACSACIREGDDPIFLALIPGMFEVDSGDLWVEGFVKELCDTLALDYSSIRILTSKDRTPDKEGRGWG